MPEKEIFFNWKSLRNCTVAGIGFLADAYDLFAINIDPPQSDNDKSLVASTALWGAIVGQLFFGSIADYVGRRVIFMATLLLISLGAMLSATCVQSSRMSLYQQLAVYRFILGLGVGGEYPLSAAYSSESSSAALKGKTGAGNVLSCVTMVCLLYAGVGLDLAWRVGLGLGAAPGLLVAYFRSRIGETEDFVRVRASRTSHWGNVRAALKVYWQPLLGTAGSWLLLDITFYGNGLFSGTITELMGLGTGPRDAALNALYVSLMALPGYLLAVAFMDRVGRHRLQWVGSVLIGALYLLLGLAFDSLKQFPPLFLILYGMTFLFSNFGPNTTTYVIPGEYFPPEVRATCHGLSAAAGKMGAAIAAYSFPPLQGVMGIRGLLVLCGVVALLGAGWTWLLVPDYCPVHRYAEMQARTRRFLVEAQRQGAGHEAGGDGYRLALMGCEGADDTAPGETLGVTETRGSLGATEDVVDARLEAQAVCLAAYRARPKSPESMWSGTHQLPQES